jgi:hypothetical protein
LLTGLQTQQSLKNNQYPLTVTEANNVLSNHRFDNNNNNSTRRQNDKSSEKQEKESKEGKDTEESPEMSFAMLEGKCYCCRLKDKTPKDEWAINKAKVKEQSHVATEQQKSETKETTETRVGWSGAHIQFQFYQAKEMKEWILLDNGSIVDLFCNPNLVQNIKTTNETLVLSTNVGNLFTNKCATVPGYVEVWYDPNAITRNIESLMTLNNQHLLYIYQIKKLGLRKQKVVYFSLNPVTVHRQQNRTT